MGERQYNVVLTQVPQSKIADLIEWCELEGIAVDSMKIDDSQPRRSPQKARQNTPLPGHRPRKYATSTVSKTGITRKYLIDTDVVKVYRARGSRVEIADRFGIAPATVTRIRGAQGRFGPILVAQGAIKA